MCSSDLGAEPRLAAHGGVNQRRPAEQGRLHVPGMSGGRRGRWFQERVQVRQHGGQAARLHAGEGGLAVAARGCRFSEWLERRQPIECFPAAPQVVRPAETGDAGDLRRVESPRSAVDEAAAQHRDQVSEPPAVRGQPQQSPHPDAERTTGERLAGHGIQRQVVLGEHLPRQGQDRTEPAERHAAVRRTEAPVVGEPPLDGARHGAQLCFPIGGNPSLHPGVRQAPARAFELRIREQPLQPLVGVAGACARRGVERQQQVAVAGERGQQAQLAVVEEPEAIDDHRGG